MIIKLTDTQKKILEWSAKNPEKDILEHIKLPGAAKQKVFNALMDKGVIWKSADGSYCISPEGLIAIGAAKPSEFPELLETEEKPAKKGNKVPAPTPAPSQTVFKGKTGMLVDLMSKPDGTGLQELMDATGWQAHSVRGAISNLKKKNGLNIEVRKNGRESFYCII